MEVDNKLNDNNLNDLDFDAITSDVFKQLSELNKCIDKITQMKGMTQDIFFLLFYI